MYVLRRSGDGAFVARRGMPSSYTKKLQDARIFPTKEQADRDRCPENEHIVAVDDLLRGNR